MNIFFSVKMIAIGLFGLFAKDQAWKWQEWKNRQGGLVSEKPDNWDSSTTLGGGFFLATGILGLILTLVTM